MVWNLSSFAQCRPLIKFPAGKQYFSRHLELRACIGIYLMEGLFVNLVQFDFTNIARSCGRERLSFGMLFRQFFNIKKYSNKWSCRKFATLKNWQIHHFFLTRSIDALEFEKIQSCRTVLNAFTSVTMGDFPSLYQLKTTR